MLLLTSSFTFGLAALTMKYRQNRAQLLMWLGVTFACGIGFVGLEIHDFYLLATVKHATPQVSGFLSSYWALVATHGLHVSMGLLWILHSIVQVLVLGVVRDVKLRILRLALFWHLLDVVWIGIFTFVFLFGAAS